MIMLTREQISVFDYLPKPMIPLDMLQEVVLNQYCSALKPSKSSHQRACEAQTAFKLLLDNPSDLVN